MKSLLSFAALLLTVLCPVIGHAQSCGLISDEAGVLNGSVQTGPLIDHGADLHVITVPTFQKYGKTIRAVEDAYEAKCPSWRAPAGGEKANLVSIVLAIQEHAKAIYVGSAYKQVLGAPNAGAVQDTFSKAANPFFRKSQYSEGLSTAISDFGGMLAAYHDQALHPVQQTTTIVNNEKPTDLHGFWVLLGWLLAITVIGLVIYYTLKFFRDKKEYEAEIGVAQQKAIRARNDATDTFMALDKSGPLFSQFSPKYTSLSDSVKYDPTTSGLSLEEYNNIADDWRDFEGDIVKALHQSGAPTPSPSTSHEKHRYAPRSVPNPPNPNAGSTVPPAPAPQTVIVNNGNSSGDGFVSGMVMGEILSDDRHRNDEERYTRREPEPDPEPVRATSGSDSSWGSSSSSSRDDDSSSSGSSSSWDSSSSDSSSSFDSSSSDSGSSGSDSSW
jgi:uncharacterized membrane protein YgcG